MTTKEGIQEVKDFCKKNGYEYYDAYTKEWFRWGWDRALTVECTTRLAKEAYPYTPII